MTLVKGWENIWYLEIFGFNFVVMVIRWHLVILNSMGQALDHIQSLLRSSWRIWCFWGELIWWWRIQSFAKRRMPEEIQSDIVNVKYHLRIYSKNSIRKKVINVLYCIQYQPQKSCHHIQFWGIFSLIEYLEYVQNENIPQNWIWWQDFWGWYWIQYNTLMTFFSNRILVISPYMVSR